MTNACARSSSLKSNVRGATVVEFALIIPALAITILAFIDLGYRMFLTSQVQGTLQQAARLASIGDSTETQVDNFVKDQLSALVDTQYVKITKRSYTDFSRVGKPEKITSDTDPKGQYNRGDCFEDANGNGSYDISGGANGLGGADDIVYYEIEVDYPRLVPLGGLLGWGPREIVKANTVLRNQPFAEKAKPEIVCAK
jgi:Flp pilus assembly pilin Flp